MRIGPLSRSLGIAVLTVGLLGSLVAGGAGWSLEAVPTDDASGPDEIVVFGGASYDLGAEYRDVEASAAQASGGTDRAATADLSALPSELATALIAPADRNAEPRIGGLLYAHAVSLVGAALVAGRALVGWRVDGRRLTLEPTGRLPFGGIGRDPADRQQSRTSHAPRGGE